MTEVPNSNGTGKPADEPAQEGRGRRLPPPAFPPGMKGVARRRAAAADQGLSSAFISPDEPIERHEPRGSGSGFISPDDPIPHRAPRSTPVAVEEDFDMDDVVVTGIGDDPHLDPEELALGFDPHVLELVGAVGKLAEALKRKGEAGLRTTADMSRFEATLRSYCVGYLAGRRAEDEEG